MQGAQVRDRGQCGQRAAKRVEQYEDPEDPVGGLYLVRYCGLLHGAGVVLS